MATIFDYLDWRGDLPFEAVPAGEVDFAIFAALIYANFEALPSEAFGNSLAELGERYGDALHQPETSELRRNVNALWDRLCVCPRFAAVHLDRFAECFEAGEDGEDDTQFAAATFRLPGGEPVQAVVTFRGTDSTMVGWREDFAMAYTQSVPAQRDALAYLEDACATYQAIHLCGHSKGGNLALFAAAGASQPRLLQSVWNFDGPGLREAQLAQPAWAKVAPRCHTLVPESSVFGMLFGEGQPREPICAEGVSLAQHSLFLWQLMGSAFVRAEGRNASSETFARGLAQYMADTTDEERRTFANALFKLAEASGATTFGALLSAVAKNLPGIMKKGDLYTDDEKLALRTFWECLVKGGVDGLGASLGLPEVEWPAWLKAGGNAEGEQA